MVASKLASTWPYGVAYGPAAALASVIVVVAPPGSVTVSATIRNAWFDSSCGAGCIGSASPADPAWSSAAVIVNEVSSSVVKSLSVVEGTSLTGSTVNRNVLEVISLSEVVVKSLSSPASSTVTVMIDVP